MVLENLRYEEGCHLMCLHSLFDRGDALKDVEHVKALLCHQFDMKDLGELRYFLGIEMICNEGGIWQSQKKYGLDMLMKYGMADCKPIFTPLDQNLKSRIDEGEVLDGATMYRRIVGSLIYMTISRPDLSYAVGLVSQFMQLPRKPHLDAMRRILRRYVRATLDYTLFYDTSTQVQVHGYTNFDWTGSSFDCQSTNGYMFPFGSAAITWSSKKQSTVAFSSTEAQYRVAALADCEVAWLEMLLQDLEI
ncbi:hypothetical protein L7F22_053808 [Adiantum nelumboides]|nr:hypothetical protein [Adiantum nelumboides]